MESMAQEPPSAPQAPPVEVCYRHPGVQTGVHCTRCGRPICPDCMIPAPVGYHCPDCVLQAQREFRAGAGRRTRKLAGLSMTKLLLAAIVGMYIVEVVASGGSGGLFLGPSNRTLFDLGAMYAPAVAAGQYWRLFSSMFLHAGLIHLALNSYALWIFGPVVEQVFGRVRFLAIYFVSGFLASAASYAFGPVSIAVFQGRPEVVGAVAVGASGAIVGVFGAFIAYNFRRRHLAMARARLRMAVTLIAINALLTLGVPSIDWRAHAGGLVAGFAAGFLAEGAGPRKLRPVVQILALAGLIAAGIALLVWRTNAINTLARSIG